MPTQAHTPVAIVGGGPVGLTLALHLGRQGIRSTLVERAPRTGGPLQAKADLLNERTMEFCRHLGIADEIARTGFPDDVPRDTVYCTSLNGFPIGRDALPATRDRPLPPQCREMHRRCPQFVLDPLLARAVTAQGMTDLRYETTFVSLAQDDSGVQCVTRDARGTEVTLTADYVVGCDGLTSAVRKALNIDFYGEQLDYSVSAVVRAKNLDRYHPFGPAERYMFIDENGPWANLTFMDGDSLFRFTVFGSQTRVDGAQQEMREFLLRAFGRADIPFEIMHVVPWRRSQFTAERFSQGRVFLAGDSAHTMSPTGGHGLNTGFGDVMDLGWILPALLRGWGGPMLPEAYTAERRAVAVRNGSTSTKNYAVWAERSRQDNLLSPGPAGDAQRAALGQYLSASLKQEWHSLGVAMGYSYAESPVVVRDGCPAPPDDPSDYVQSARPGHRAPHFWLDDGRSSIDLFWNRFVLLDFGTATEPGAIARLRSAADVVGMPLAHIQAHDPAAALYGKDLALVRPDGMVAWRGDALPAAVGELVDRVRGVC
jgi:2-polyprenyl-6-methoxyphenol hydroxylase-like FAD-dependent oxidoreductase